MHVLINHVPSLLGRRRLTEMCIKIMYNIICVGIIYEYIEVQLHNITIVYGYHILYTYYYEIIIITGGAVDCQL